MEFDETCIQVGRQSKAKVLARRGSNVVYNIIPKSWEWLIINCAINATNVILLRFYIFIGERLRNDYMKFCKLKRCMVVQKKAWMTFICLKSSYLSTFHMRNYKEWVQNLKLINIDLEMSKLQGIYSKSKTCKHWSTPINSNPKISQH
jgi:hypothetical protein